MKIEIDSKQIDKLFHDLTDQKQSIKLLRNGLSVGSRIITKSSKDVLYKSIKNKGLTFSDMYNGIFFKYHKLSNGLYSNILVRGHKRYKRSVLLNILGASKEGNRKTSKGYNRGSIQRINFFQNVDENKVYTKMSENIEKNYQKLFNK